MNDQRLLDVERWIAWVRLAAVLFAALEVGVFTERFPPGYERLAWALTGGLRGRRSASLRCEPSRPQGVAAPGRGRARVRHGRDQRLRAPLLVRVRKPDALGSHLPGRGGGASVRPARWRHRAALPLPTLAFLEWWRADRFGPPGFSWDRVTFPFGILLLTGLIVGWLVARLRQEAAAATGQRAPRPSSCATGSAGASTCSRRRTAARRALGSSLDLDEAFGAFIRELRGLVPFDRTAIVLVGRRRRARWRPPAAAPTRSSRPAAAGRSRDRSSSGCSRGETVVPRGHARDALLRGERARCGSACAASSSRRCSLGARAIGMISRRPRGAATRSRTDEVELVSLLGRLVATAVQNIRAYEAERTTRRGAARACRHCAPTSSRSSRTSCAARWRR